MKKYTDTEIDVLRSELEKKFNDSNILTDDGFMSFGHDAASSASHDAIVFMVEKGILNLDPNNKIWKP